MGPDADARQQGRRLMGVARHDLKDFVPNVSKLALVADPDSLLTEGC